MATTDKKKPNRLKLFLQQPWRDAFPSIRRQGAKKPGGGGTWDTKQKKYVKQSWNERQKASTHVTGKSRTWREDPKENRKLQQKAKKSGVKSTYNTPSTKKTPKKSSSGEWKPTAIQKKLMKGGWTKEELQAKQAKHKQWKDDRKRGKLKAKKFDPRAGRR
tara:strand:+ start:193 stop:675 length:483 start_codon:yes stop_codon:yes gene_type:complete